MSREIQEIFSSIAPNYDFLNHFLSFSIDKRWRKKAVQALSAVTPRRVLDLCAGTLDLSQKIIETLPEAEVVALDFAMPMLEEGKHKIKGSARAHRICGDGHRLPFAPSSFDAVVCGFGIRNLEKREAAASEIRRVLKSDGVLVVLEFFRPQKLIPQLFYHTYGKYILPRVGGAFSKNRAAYQYLQDSIQKFLSEKEYCALLKAHGFNKTRSRPLSGGISHLIVAQG